MKRTSTAMPRTATAAIMCALMWSADAFAPHARVLPMRRAGLDGTTCPRNHVLPGLAASKMVASTGKSQMVVEGPFKGQFGEWVVDEADAAEVLIYRGSLVGTALSASAAVSMALLPGAMGLDDAPAWAFDAAAAAFFASFGVSVSTIHIYMKPMHNFLKVLWAAGALGSLIVLFASPDHSLVVNSFEHPELLLASGWVFVALTGLFFKEFACFQRWEASALFGIVPLLTGGHFLHLLPEGLEAGLAATFAFVFPFFAFRKFDQPLKSDIGDKTIFQYFKRVETGQLTEQDKTVARSMGMDSQ